MTITTEIRRDPITGRSVVIDRAPFTRKTDFDLEPARLEDGWGPQRLQGCS